MRGWAKRLGRIVLGILLAGLALTVWGLGSLQNGVIGDVEGFAVGSFLIVCAVVATICGIRDLLRRRRGLLPWE